MTFRAKPAIVLWAVMSSAAYAQNPCTGALPPPVIITANSEVLAALAAQNTVLGGVPVVTSYSLGVFLAGVDPAKGGMPVSQIPIAKTAWTLKSTTVDCYGVKPTELLAVPVNQETFLALKSIQSSTGLESAWSPLSNPFGRLGPPPVPTGTRITP